MTGIPLAACLLPSLLLYFAAARRLRRAVRGPAQPAPAALCALDAPATGLAVLAMCLFGLPLPVFYLLFYAAGCLARGRLLAGGQGEWLFLNVRFLVFAAPHLIAVGALALRAQTGAAAVLDDGSLRTLGLLAAVLLDAAAFFALSLQPPDGRPRIWHWDSEEARLFSKFVWFCCWCVFFDSIPCLFWLPPLFPALFLIGSNLLLLVMALLFARHLNAIQRDSHLRETALALQEEAAAQHSRTVRLEQEAYLDQLTRAYTRQYALSNMQSMLQGGESFALAFLDLDGLKEVNDRLGHLAGDAYLRDFSDRMRGRLRPKDIFVRYGGDEFLIILPELDEGEAAGLIGAVRAQACAAPPEGWGIPFSYGLAAARPGEGLSPADWIALADRAMYGDKKRRGRGEVRC